MKTQLHFLGALVLLGMVGFLSCKGPKEVMESSIDMTFLDTMMVVASPLENGATNAKYDLPIYNASATRKFDLIHTDLEVAFDLEKEHVLGVATLDLQPFFYASDLLELDAKGFDIGSVILLKLDGPKTLDYDYNGEVLAIKLDRVYKKEERLKIRIKYTAKPSERKKGGSDAITDDQGLYFVNSAGKENKPTQIWTQGETESSSCWFPTIDKPNERCTQEIRVKVDQRFETLSNGLLKGQKDNADGTRTDTWVMDQPHAPYLFMLAIGEFAVVREDWKGKEMSYYVEKEYEAFAKNIFAHTPEMMDFFSEKFGVDYPWDKYAQVIVRDFVSGAMENTTAVIFGDFVQKTDRELIDNHNDRIVAHELAHHWFGDLVTCESWANLPLNESFANYSEYLWMHHKYGADEANYHLMSELEGYLYQSKREMHDLVYFDYADKEETFDSHSYNKGGCILHMLRKITGDEAFFAALNHYLVKHEYSDVEAHELRLSFEDVTGQDYSWFFDQWFFDKGHPMIEVTQNYDSSTQVLELILEQTQDAKLSRPVFILPLDVAVYVNGKKEVFPILFDSRRQRFELNLNGQPELVLLDPEHVLVGEINQERVPKDWVYLLENSDHFLDRFRAVQQLGFAGGDELPNSIETAMNDPFFAVRKEILRLVPRANLADYSTSLKDLALNDPHSEVQSQAIDLLGETKDLEMVDVYKKGMESQSYAVVSSSLEAWFAADEKSGIQAAKSLENSSNQDILASIGRIYSETEDVAYIGFFEKNWSKSTGYAAISFFDNYVSLSILGGAEKIENALARLEETALNAQESGYRRYAGTKGLDTVRAYYKSRVDTASAEDKEVWQEKIKIITGVINKIKEKESSGYLKRWYSGF